MDIKIMLAILLVLFISEVYNGAHTRSVDQCRGCETHDHRSP
jgi:hypothetical protein